MRSLWSLLLCPQSRMFSGLMSAWMMRQHSCRKCSPASTWPVRQHCHTSPERVPTASPAPAAARAGRHSGSESGTVWALMVTIGSKWFPVGVAYGSRHKGFITPHSSRAPGASEGLDSPVRKGLFGVTHSKRQRDNPQISARMGKPREVGGGWGYEEAIMITKLNFFLKKHFCLYGC